MRDAEAPLETHYKQLRRTPAPLCRMAETETNRTHHVMSYPNTLARAECEENVKPTVKKTNILIFRRVVRDSHGSWTFAEMSAVWRATYKQGENRGGAGKTGCGVLERT